MPIEKKSIAGNIFLETSRQLALQAEQRSSILVSYSGGKDSNCVLDLCCKAFSKVVCFHLYFVPGLRCIEDSLEYARKRWNVEILQYPHWTAFRCIKNGVFCPNHFRFDDIPEFTIHDIEAMVMADTGLDRIYHGGKRADGIWRRRMLNNTANREERVYPLLHWNRWDTLAYMSANKIPIPEQDGSRASGVDLSTPAILWLHDSHPEDFAILEKHFPYVRSVVYRRQWYGVD